MDGVPSWILAENEGREELNGGNGFEENIDWHSAIMYAKWTEQYLLNHHSFLTENQDQIETA